VRIFDSLAPIRRQVDRFKVDWAGPVGRLGTS